MEKLFTVITIASLIIALFATVSIMEKQVNGQLAEDMAYICLKNVDNNSKHFGDIECSEFPYLDNDIFNDEIREKIEMKFAYGLDLWKYGK